MKKKLSLLLSLCLGIVYCFCGCEGLGPRVRPHKYNYEELINQVVSIEIVYTEDLFSKYEEIYDMQVEIYECLAVLNGGEIEPFLKQFCELNFMYAVHSGNPNGNAVKFIYEDNSYIIYGVSGALLYDAMGVCYNMGPAIRGSYKGFYALISQYAELRNDPWWPEVLESSND